MAKTYVRASALADWQQALSELAADPRLSCAEIAAEVDTLMGAGPRRIELASFVDLLERIGLSTRQPYLAWSIGQQTEYSLDSDFGKAILGCKSLGSALHWLAYFFPLVQDASSLKLEVDDDWATLSYKILDPNIWPRHEDALYSLGIYSHLVRAAAPDAWCHAQVTVEVEQSRARPDLSNVTQAEVLYGGNTNSIRFPSAVLDAPLNLAPPCDGAVMKRLSRELTQKYRSTSTSERTRQMIFNEMNEGCVNQEHIARSLGISSRTLRRRLSSEDQSFQALLDDCRMQFAAHEFRTRRRLSLSDMALKLGYSEHSTFSRAFSRWAGMAPQEYRRSVALH